MLKQKVDGMTICLLLLPQNSNGQENKMLKFMPPFQSGIEKKELSEEGSNFSHYFGSFLSLGMKPLSHIFHIVS